MRMSNLLKKTAALCALVACSSPAAALESMTDAQRQYLAARTFEMQMEAFRDICSQASEPGALVEAAIATFARQNQRYGAALAAKPGDPEYTAGITSFEGQFQSQVPAMRKQLEAGDLDTGCRTIARQIAATSFDDLVQRTLKQEQRLRK